MLLLSAFLWTAIQQANNRAVWLARLSARRWGWFAHHCSASPRQRAPSSFGPVFSAVRDASLIGRYRAAAVVLAYFWRSRRFPATFSARQSRPIPITFLLSRRLRAGASFPADDINGSSISMETPWAQWSIRCFWGNAFIHSEFTRRRPDGMSVCVSYARSPPASFPFNGEPGALLAAECNQTAPAFLAAGAPLGYSKKGFVAENRQMLVRDPVRFGNRWPQTLRRQQVGGFMRRARASDQWAPSVTVPFSFPGPNYNTDVNAPACSPQAQIASWVG